MELAPLAFPAGILSIRRHLAFPHSRLFLYMGEVATGDGSNRRRVVGAALFVLGARPLFLKVPGVFMILMGLSMLGVLSFLYKEKRSEEYARESRATGFFERHALLIERAGCGCW